MVTILNPRTLITAASFTCPGKGAAQGLLIFSSSSLPGGCSAPPAASRALWMDEDIPWFPSDEYSPSSGTRVMMLSHTLTLFSPSGARGSVIHDPKREPEVLIVIGSLIPVSFPQAGKEGKAGEHHDSPRGAQHHPTRSSVPC